MCKGDLNENRREAKHDGARVDRNVWKAQPTCNSEVFLQSWANAPLDTFHSPKQSVLRCNDPRSDSEPAAERDHRLPAALPPLPARSPAVAELPPSPLISQLSQGLQQGMKPFAGPAPDKEVFPGLMKKLSWT